MAWHPEGNNIFSVYNADDGDSQISRLNLNRTKGVRGLLEIDYWRLINYCIHVLVVHLPMYKGGARKVFFGTAFRKKEKGKKKVFLDACYLCLV